MNCSRFRFLIQQRFDMEISPADDRALLMHFETCDSCQKFHHQVQQVILAAEELPIQEDLLPPQMESLAGKVLAQMPKPKQDIFGAVLGFFQNKGGKSDDDTKSSIRPPSQFPHISKQQTVEPPAAAFEAQSGGHKFHLSEELKEPILAPLDNREMQSSTGSLLIKFGMSPTVESSGKDQPLTLADSIRRKISESSQQTLSPISSQTRLQSIDSWGTLPSVETSQQTTGQQIQSSNIFTPVQQPTPIQAVPQAPSDPPNIFAQPQTQSSAPIASDWGTLPAHPGPHSANAFTPGTEDSGDSWSWTIEQSQDLPPINAKQNWSPQAEQFETGAWQAFKPEPLDALGAKVPKGAPKSIDPFAQPVGQTIPTLPVPTQDPTPVDNWDMSIQEKLAAQNSVSQEVPSQQAQTPSPDFDLWSLSEAPSAPQTAEQTPANLASEVLNKLDSVLVQNTQFPSPKISPVSVQKIVTPSEFSATASASTATVAPPATVAAPAVPTMRPVSSARSVEPVAAQPVPSIAPSQAMQINETTSLFSEPLEPFAFEQNLPPIEFTEPVEPIMPVQPTVPPMQFTAPEPIKPVQPAPPIQFTALEPVPPMQFTAPVESVDSLAPVQPVLQPAPLSQENSGLFSLDDQDIDKLFSENLGISEVPVGGSPTAAPIIQEQPIQSPVNESANLDFPSVWGTPEQLVSQPEPVVPQPVVQSPSVSSLTNLGDLVSNISVPIPTPSTPTKEATTSQPSGGLFSVDSEMIDRIFADQLGIVEPSPQQINPAKSVVPVVPIQPIVQPAIAPQPQVVVAPTKPIAEEVSPPTPPANLYQAPTSPTVAQSVPPTPQPPKPEIATSSSSVLKIEGLGRLDTQQRSTEINEEVSTGRIDSIGKFLLDGKDLETIERITASNPVAGKVRILTQEAANELQGLLNKISAQKGVVGSVIIGHDGLLIANTMPSDLEAESYGIWALGVYMNTCNATKKIGSKQVHQIVSKTSKGYLIIADFGDGLLVTASDGSALEELIPLMRNITQLVAA